MLGKKKNKKKPYIRCMALNSNWHSQFSEIENDIKIGSQATMILGLKDLMVQDPIAAKVALQTISTKVQAAKYQMAALSRDMIIITPFQLVV
ncbi:MAG: hypothetical protein ACXAC7_07800 [Candidatus Hodarchaeales archaeon]|jgi:hypothetical protein